MKEFIQLMAALLGSLGFAALFNIRGKKINICHHRRFSVMGNLSGSCLYQCKPLFLRIYFHGTDNSLCRSDGPYGQNTGYCIPGICHHPTDSRGCPLPCHELSYAQKLCRLFQRRNLHTSLCCQHVCRNYFYHCGFPYDLAPALQQQKHTYLLKN